MTLYGIIGIAGAAAAVALFVDFSPAFDRQVLIRTSADSIFATMRLPEYQGTHGNIFEFGLQLACLIALVAIIKTVVTRRKRSE